MDIASPWFAVLWLLLMHAAFGAVVVATAQAAARRFGRRGLFTWWLAGTVSLSALATWWFLRELHTASPVWGVFLTPFLFLAVELGVVARYLARRDDAPRGRRFAMALLLYVVAAIPAGILAQIPDLIYMNTGR